MRLTWYGHAAWSIEINGTKILIDPFFTGRRNPGSETSET
ncbi:MAG: MBL fold metallo-hydrolase [Spirochaetales bacterium]|nr:MBL fold metallo-hydrolase [Spirochaetales bacterium]